MLSSTVGDIWCAMGNIEMTPNSDLGRLDVFGRHYIQLEARRLRRCYSDPRLRSWEKGVTVSGRGSTISNGMLFTSRKQLAVARAEVAEGGTLEDKDEEINFFKNQALLGHCSCCSLCLKWPGSLLLTLRLNLAMISSVKCSLTLLSDTIFI